MSLGALVHLVHKLADLFCKIYVGNLGQRLPTPRGVFIAGERRGKLCLTVDAKIDYYRSNYMEGWQTTNGGDCLLAKIEHLPCVENPEPCLLAKIEHPPWVEKHICQSNVVGRDGERERERERGGGGRKGLPSLLLLTGQG